MAAGDIGPVLGTGIFDAISGNEPSVTHISGHVYAVAYRGQGNHGFLRTLTISDDGTTIALTGSSLEFDNVSGYAPRLIHVSGDVYAIAYWNATSSDGIVKTVSIDNAGNIGSIHSFTFDATKGWTPDIIHIFGDVYAIAYRRNLDHGFLITLTISADGTTIALTGSSLEFDISYASSPQLIKISGDVYAIAYEISSTTYGIKVCTMTISNTGVIGGATIDDWLIDTPPSQAFKAKILHISGNVFAVTSQENLTSDGWVVTFNIGTDGVICPSPPCFCIGKLEFDTDKGTYPDIIHIGGNIFAITYSGPTGGTLITLTISNDGTAIALTGSSLQFDTGVDIYPTLIHIGDVYAVVYNHTPGTVKTMDIQTLSIPTVTTNPATAVEATAATGNGNITDNGGEDCDKRGFVYNTSPHGDPGDTAPADSEYSDYVEETDSFGTGAFTGALTSLEPKTTYYIRAYAHNSAGYSYGNEVSFTTLVAIPSVTTQEMTGVEPTTATGNGNVTDLGGESLSQHGHCWSTSHDPTTSDDKTELGAKSEIGAFTSSLTGLSPNTVYYCRAYATNSAGTSYGSEVSFTTPVGLPTVTTEAASAIGLNGATLNGALTSDGGEPCYCGFQWGVTIPYSTTTPTQRKVTGEVFSQPILNLGEAAQYHFRAFATNSAGTAYGEDRTIDTLFRTNKAYALARYEV